MSVILTLREDHEFKANLRCLPRICPKQKIKLKIKKKKKKEKEKKIPQRKLSN
jgi:hypothetical protein